MSHCKIRDKKKANKTLADFSGILSFNVYANGDLIKVTAHFNRSGQLHDISPRVIETTEYRIPLFDDLHGRTMDAVQQYFSSTNNVD